MIRLGGELRNGFRSIVINFTKSSYLSTSLLCLVALLTLPFGGSASAFKESSSTVDDNVLALVLAKDAFPRRPLPRGAGLEGV